MFTSKIIKFSETNYVGDYYYIRRYALSEYGCYYHSGNNANDYETCYGTLSEVFAEYKANINAMAI